jgi:hypothetical protein
MRGAVLIISYVLATFLATVAWLWMIADLARWVAGF